ncbi:glycosyltransferase family 39 protein [Candidatus Saccharibacteria bacterium]|nr:MAG: glycosyltransferase family 39 protein [Candidatus Saccharibacteria bacterium]
MKRFLKRTMRHVNTKNLPYMIGCVAAVAMVASLFIGMKQSVWFDEAYSILVARHSPSEIISLTAVDTHPPAYYLLLHVWGAMVGWNEFALRSLSVLAYGGSIFVAGLLAKRLFGTRAAVITSIFLLMAPLLMRYGFEIRMYALASLIGVLATLCLVAAHESPRKWWLWVLYGVLVAVGVYTLYYLALLWIAHLVWLLYIDRKQRQTFWRQSWLWSYAIGIVLFLPWLPTFLKQVNNGALASIGQPMNFEQLIGIVSFNALYKPLWQISVLETPLMLYVLVVGCWFVARAYKMQRSTKYLTLLLLYIGVPVLVLGVVSLFRPMYVERYLSHVAVGLVMLVACSVAIVWSYDQSRRVAAMSVSFFLIMALGTLQLMNVGNFNFQRMEHPKVDEVTVSIPSCRSTDTVVAADPYVATELSYYLPASCRMLFYSDTAELGGGYAPFSYSDRRLASKNLPLVGQNMWYVYYGQPQLVPDTSYRRTNISTLGTLTVTRYEK